MINKNRGNGKNKKERREQKVQGSLWLASRQPAKWWIQANHGSSTPSPMTYVRKGLS